MLERLVVSLALTLALELAFALAWGLRDRRELAVTALVNCLTNPPAVLLHYTAVHVWGWGNVPVTAVLELAVVLVEWRCYEACSQRLARPLLFAVLANAFSYGTGLVLNRLVP